MVDQGLIPRRYAKALYKYALEKGVDRDVYDMSGALVDSFIANPSLQTTMANPFVSDTDKKRLLLTAAGAQDSPVMTDFITLLAHNKRLDCARDIAVAYRDIYRKANSIYRVHVTSAAPLDPVEEQRLKALVKSHLNGGTMEYTSSVNPDLIGGFTVSVDNDRLDASVANELAQLKQRLIQN